MDGPWVVIAFISVADLEQLLITDEYLVSNSEVPLQITRAIRRSHRDVQSREIRGSAHEFGRGPICNGTVLAASGSSDFRPEQAWQRAQPAFAVPEFIPRSVIYA